MPGRQGRSVPFVRPCRNISRQHIVVSSAQEHAIEENNMKNNDFRSNGTSREGIGGMTSNGLLAVHGGELGGRPRVSGTQVDSINLRDMVI